VFFWDVEGGYSMPATNDLSLVQSEEGKGYIFFIPRLPQVTSHFVLVEWAKEQLQTNKKGWVSDHRHQNCPFKIKFKSN
jgi:hypothetical protein